MSIMKSVKGCCPPLALPATSIGSYPGTQESYFQMFQHESPWHQGAPGWTQAPVPGWGMNPNLRGPARVGTGAYYDDPVNLPVGPVGADSSTQKLSTVAMVGWAAVLGLTAYIFYRTVKA